MNKTQKNGILLLISAVLLFFIFPILHIFGPILYIPMAISLVLTIFGIKKLIPKRDKEKEVVISKLYKGVQILHLIIPSLIFIGSLY